MSNNPMNELAPIEGWRRMVVPRITTPAERQRGRLFRGISRISTRFGRSEVPDVFAVFSRHQRLFWPWLLFASRLMPYGRLPADIREKIILRTAWNCRSHYEWGQHVDISLRVGLRDEDIVGIAKGTMANSDDQTILRACDELFANQVLSDDTWQKLKCLYDEKLLIEIVILVGHYVMLAGLLNSAGTSLEPAQEQVLSQFHGRIQHMLIV